MTDLPSGPTRGWLYAGLMLRIGSQARFWGWGEGPQTGFPAR